MLRRSFIATTIVAALSACATFAVDVNAVGNLADLQINGIRALRFRGRCRGRTGAR